MAKKITRIQSLIMSLVSEVIADEDSPKQIRALGEALAKEQGLATYAERVLRADVG